MHDPRFHTLDARDVYKMICTEIYRVLETASGPALYKNGCMRLDVRTRDGRCVCPEQSLPDNWRDLTFALSALRVITGATGWERVIQRDDGEVFVINLGYADGGEVQVVL